MFLGFADFIKMPVAAVYDLLANLSVGLSVKRNILTTQQISFTFVCFWVWFCKFCRFCPRSLLPLDADLIDKIPGQQTDRRTPLGELNWIFTAITDTIAWTVLPRGGHSVSWIPINSFSYVMLS
jgi:hypothetical protein